MTRLRRSLRSKSIAIYDNSLRRSCVLGFVLPPHRQQRKSRGRRRRAASLLGRALEAQGGVKCASKCAAHFAPREQKTESSLEMRSAGEGLSKFMVRKVDAEGCKRSNVLASNVLAAEAMVMLPTSARILSFSFSLT
jgi:hypothetical protein